VVNLWEAQIKHALGKMDLPDPLPEIVRQQHQINGFGLLTVLADHVYQLDRLATHHKDPFDRLLIAQAVHEGLTLVTQDKAIKKYAVAHLW
jgi:PIN domain nuclease of toxin-antitoxin system